MKAKKEIQMTVFCPSCHSYNFCVVYDRAVNYCGCERREWVIERQRDGVHVMCLCVCYVHYASHMLTYFLCVYACVCDLAAPQRGVIWMWPRWVSTRGCSLPMQWFAKLNTRLQLILSLMGSPQIQNLPSSVTCTKCVQKLRWIQPNIDQQPTQHPR